MGLTWEFQPVSEPVAIPFKAGALNQWSVFFPYQLKVGENPRLLWFPWILDCHAVSKA